MRRLLLSLLLLAPGPAWAQYLPAPIPLDGSITPAKLASDAPADNECLTYDLGTLSFEWDTCGSGGSGDNIRVEDGDNAGTYTAATDADFDDSGDINFALNTGTTPDTITATVRADSVALTTDTTGNYAAGDAEAGAALTGDSATSFFGAGEIETTRGGTGANNTATSGRFLRGDGTDFVTSSGAASGTGSCSAGSAVTATVDDTAPTCDANVMFDDEANTLTQNLTLNDGTTNSPSLIFTPQTGATWTIFGEDTSGDLEIRTNSSSNTQMNLVNTGTGVSNITIDGDVLGSGTSSSSNHPGGGADDQVLVASSSTVSDWKTLPNGAVSYATGSNAFAQAGISNLAASTSADLRGVLSDESGTGAALFAGATDVGLHRTLVTLGSDVASTASTSFQDVTGLSFSVTSGTNYRYYCILLYTTSDATIGLRVSVNAPSFTHNAYMVRTPITVSGSLTLVEFVNGASAVNTGTTSSGSMNTTGGNIAILEGIIRPSANGTLQVRFAPETATSNGVVIETGSTCEWW